MALPWLMAEALYELVLGPTRTPFSHLALRVWCVRLRVAASRSNGKGHGPMREL